MLVGYQLEEVIDQVDGDGVVLRCESVILEHQLVEEGGGPEPTGPRTIPLVAWQESLLLFCWLEELLFDWCVAAAATVAEDEFERPLVAWGSIWMKSCSSIGCNEASILLCWQWAILVSSLSTNSTWSWLDQVSKRLMYSSCSVESMLWCCVTRVGVSLSLYV